MTDEQNLVYLQTQIACAYCELEAMKAENQQRAVLGQSVAYNEAAFMDIITKYGLGHNAVITFLYP